MLLFCFPVASLLWESEIRLLSVLNAAVFRVSIVNPSKLELFPTNPETKDVLWEWTAVPLNCFGGEEQLPLARERAPAVTMQLFVGMIL